MRVIKVTYNKKVIEVLTFQRKTCKIIVIKETKLRIIIVAGEQHGIHRLWLLPNFNI